MGKFDSNFFARHASRFQKERVLSNLLLEVDMPRQEFEAELVKPDEPGTWTCLVVPFSVQQVFGKRGQVRVRGTINGRIREAAEVDRGDRVKVVMDIDTEARAVEVPESLRRELAAQPKAKERFDRLSYSHRREYVLWI